MKYLHLVIIINIITFSSASIYDQYYAEARRIAEGMTLDQKIGQTIQADFNAITDLQKPITDPTQAVTLNLGSLLVSGNAAPTDDGNLAKIHSYLEEDKIIQDYLKATQTNWKQFIDRFKDLGINVTATDGKKYIVKFLLATDAVHGDQHTLGTILFPHNIGMSCSWNPNHFENVGYWTKQALKKTGFNYAFAPTIAVSHNPQWGRFYETMGQDQLYVYNYAKSYVKGLQDVSNGRINGVLASAKHFFGDGSTLYGANEGSSQVRNYKKYVKHNSEGYRGAASSEVGSVMISYSAINNIPNSYNSHFMQSLLRDDLQFSGFTISDYDQVVRTQNELLPRTFMNLTENDGHSLMVNAGVDMIMLAGSKSLLDSQVARITKIAKKNVERGSIKQERLIEAVTRIVQVKMAMGLVKSLSEPQKSINIQPRIPSSSSANQYLDSLNAVRQSLVLLKNANTLPAKSLYSTIKYVVLVGEKIHNINRLTRVQLFRNYDNIGMQSGGWSVRWQGFEGNDFWTGDNKAKSNASSILDALKNIQKVNKFELLYPNYTSYTNQITIQSDRRSFISSLKAMKKNFTNKNTLIIGTFGEFPYAESVGDVNIPYCKEPDAVECLYRPSLNPYAPNVQPKTLELTMSNFELEVVTEVRELDKNIPLVSVIMSGRPLLIDKITGNSTAVLASWLPGTSGGQGIVDAIAGDYILRPNGQSDKVNTLSMDWPKAMDELSNFPVYGVDGQIPRIQNYVYQVGYGLSSFTGNEDIKIIEN